MFESESTYIVHYKCFALFRLIPGQSRKASPLCTWLWKLRWADDRLCPTVQQSQQRSRIKISLARDYRYSLPVIQSSYE
jgi:hypothetical protein